MEVLGVAQVLLEVLVQALLAVPVQVLRVTMLQTAVTAFRVMTVKDKPVAKDIHTVVLVPAP
jgi:hypothetical protein